ncbi:DUF4129 domain-containing protein [Halorientalis salina]|uniref:DUF4129 domain-containing protein n=1 Tax=Halorientalis salina TaxID=2932266 RepID=UPI00145FB8D2|nr:DUF4129 domain-containing protein [Halorientalis salina]
MNRHQLISIAVAMSCFLAVGVAATTLSSTLSSEPHEAVDLDYSYLPIESSDVADFQQDIETQKRDADAAEEPPVGGSDDGQGAGGIGDQPDRPEQRNRDDSGLAPATGDEDESGAMPEPQDGGSGPAPGNGSETIAGGDGSGGGGESDQATNEETESDADGFDPLLIALAAGLLAALLYRYRDRLPWFDGSTDGASADTDAENAWEPSPPPDANVVFAAWDALMRNVDVENTRTRTTHECANAAAKAGMDPSAIETLTRTFEEVRYGERPVTEDRRQRVSQVCQRLQLDLPEGTV